MKLTNIAFKLIFIFMTYFYSVYSRKDFKSYTKSYSISSSYASSEKGGKPKKHFKSEFFEEFRNKEDNKPEEVRQYDEMVKKDNDKSAIYRKEASTNVEKEKKVLGKEVEEKLIENKDELKQVIKKHRNHVKNLLGQKGHHSAYDEFLNERAHRLENKSS